MFDLETAYHVADKHMHLDVCHCDLNEYKTISFYRRNCKQI